MKKFFSAVLLSLVLLGSTLAVAGAINIFGDGPNDVVARRNAITIALNSGHPYRVSPWECYYLSNPIVGTFVRCEAVFSSYVP